MPPAGGVLSVGADGPKRTAYPGDLGLNRCRSTGLAARNRTEKRTLRGELVRQLDRSNLN